VIEIINLQNKKMNLKSLPVLIMAMNMLVPVVHASDLSLGVGIGRPFGIGGVNGAYTLTDHIQVAAGIGNGKLLFSGESNYSLGINYYFGEIADKWRKRIGVNYNEYQETGIQVEHRSSKGEVIDSTSSESRFKGIELDLGMRRLIGGNRNRSFEFGTTIPLIKEKTEDEDLWGQDTYTSEDDEINIHLEFYLGYRHHF